MYRILNGLLVLGAVFMLLLAGAPDPAASEDGAVSVILSDGSGVLLNEEEAAELAGQPGMELSEVAVPLPGGGYLVGSEDDFLKALASVQAPVPVTYKKLTVKKEGQGSVTSAPKGIVCGTVCEFDFRTGSKVNLTAKADVGWIFAGWTGDAVCPGIKPCGVKMDADKAVTATFVLGTPDILVTPSATEKHFGNTRSGTAKSQTYTIKNKGTGILTVGEIKSVANKQFTVETDKCTGASLAPSKTCTFKVVFRPLYGGGCGCTGQVDIPSNDLPSPYIIWFCGCGT
jgi:hypothetical protein